MDAHRVYGSGGDLFCHGVEVTFIGWDPFPWIKGGKVKRNKFRAVKTTVDNIVFASKAEAARYCELMQMQDEDKIFNLNCQVKFKVFDPEKNIILDFYSKSLRVDPGNELFIELNAYPCSAVGLI